MIIGTVANVSLAALDQLVQHIEGLGARAHVSRYDSRAVIACVGDTSHLDARAMAQFPGVGRVDAQPKPYLLASRSFQSRSSVISFGDASGTCVGGNEIVVIAGPCSVEGRAMLHDTASAVQQSGARLLRGGAFKPRSSPYAFQGMGEAGLQLLADVRAASGMPVVTEVMDTRQVELVAAYSDVLQIGARNMQNFALLKEVGRLRRPVLLKRGLSATISELLMAAEYIVAQGNSQVILCERGIRTYETATRNTLDVAAIPVLKRETHLPVIVDPSHAGGRAYLVAPLALAAIAAGADGLMVEVHPDPANALSDGEQSLTPKQFSEMMKLLRPVATAVGRSIREETSELPLHIQRSRCAA
ncbi:MAG: 3-deoxy-7-phosphoheptulonate synthase [Gemmatimonas sp.]